MEKSTSIANLATALHLFHVKMDSIKYDSVNPFFNSKYASLSHILQTIKEPLSESGLVLVQMPTDDNGLTTMLIHADSGEFISSTYHMQADKNTPQAQGSVVSYQRRYCIQSALGISFDEDDDANLSTHGITNQQYVSGAKPVQNDDKEWLNEGTAIFNKAIEKLKSGETTIAKIKSAFKVSKKTEQKLQEFIK